MYPQPSTKDHIIDILKALLSVAIVGAFQSLVPAIQQLLSHPVTETVAYASTAFATIKLTRV